MTAYPTKVVAQEDTRGVTVSPTVLSVKEADDPTTTTTNETEATYTVVLTSNPIGSDVTIVPRISNIFIGTLQSSEPLTFTRDACVLGGSVVAYPSMAFCDFGGIGFVNTTLRPGTWSQPQTVTIRGLNDDIDNVGNQRSATITHGVSGGNYASVSAASVVLTVEDDDEAGMTLSETTLSVAEVDNPDTNTNENAATYTVALTSQPTAIVSISVAADNAAVAAVEPASLTFTPSNWDDPQTVTVSGMDDDIDNTGNQRSATITHVASSLDANYGSVSAGSVVVTVRDNEMRVITSRSTGRITFRETEGTINLRGVYTIRLSEAPEFTILLRALSSDDNIILTEINGSSSTTFTPTNWNTPKTVRIAGINDDINHPMNVRTATINHSIVDDFHNNDQDLSPMTVTIEDDERVGVEVSAGNVELAESGGRATYTVVLTSQPTGTVRVSVGSDDTAVANVYQQGFQESSPTLTFTPVNWDDPQTLIIVAVDDDIDNAGDERSATITHGVSGADYGSVSAGSVVVTVTDDDSRGVTVSETTLSLEEVDDIATITSKENERSYTVVLTSQPTGGDVTVTPSSGPTGVATVEPASLTFTSNNWDDPQTLIIVAVDDDIDNAGDKRSATITHGVSGADYGSVSAGSVVVTVNDNELSVITSTTTVTLNEVNEQGLGSHRNVYTIKLSEPPTITGRVEVLLTSSDTNIAYFFGVGRNYGQLEDGSVGLYLVFTPANWDRPRTVNIGTVDDDIDNPMDMRTVTMTHRLVSRFYNSENLSSVTIIVADDDLGRSVAVSETSLSLLESEEKSYTVVLTSQPTGAVTVTPSSGATSVATVQPSTLTFMSDNWNTPQTVTVSAVDDAIDNMIDERSATITHGVSGADYGSVSADSVVVMVNDDDGAGVTLSETTLSVAEVDDPATNNTNENTATYTVALTSQPTGTVSISVAADDAAVAAVEPASLTFTPLDWDDPQTVTVSGVDDSIDNTGNQRSATITHVASGADYGSVSAGSVVVTVRDNEMRVITSRSSITFRETEGTINLRGVYTIRLSEAPKSEVFVDVFSSNNNIISIIPIDINDEFLFISFTPDNWNTPQTVRIVGINDDINHPMNVRTATITHSITSDFHNNDQDLSPITVTIEDDERFEVDVSAENVELAESGGGATYTVVLTSQSTGTVSVTPSSGAAGVATVQPSTLTFTSSNWDDPQTVTVTAVDDDIDNADDERSATITHGVSSADYGSISADSVVVTVIDDDSRGVIISATMLSLREADDPAIITSKENEGSYTVVLTSQPTGGDVIVTPSSGATGVATVQPSTLTFTSNNWDDPQTVTVSAVDDSIDNMIDEHSATITHGVSGADYGSVSADSVEVTVTDDDVVGVTVSETTLSLPESEEGSYTVVLDSQPTGGDVIVTPSSGATDVATVNPSTLTFTSSNWDDPQTVTVTAEDDSIDNVGDQRSATITHGVSGADYNGISAGSVEVTVTDDDSRGVSISTMALSLDEMDDPATTTSKENEESYTVVLTSQPTGAVTVRPSSGAATVVTVQPSTLTFTPDNWDDPQTVTVTAENDSIDNAGNQRSATILHRVSGADYSGAIVDDVVVTVTDDDTAPTSISLSANPDTVAENAAATTVTVTASVGGATTFGEDVTVTVSVGETTDTATAGSDYATVTAFPLTIPSGSATGSRHLCPVSHERQRERGGRDPLGDGQRQQSDGQRHDRHHHG